MRVGSRSSWTPRAWSGLGRNSKYGNDEPTMNSVSQFSIASCDGLVPSRPMPPVVYGTVVGHARLAQQRLDDRAGERVGQLLQFIGGLQRTAAREDGDFLPRVEHIGGPPQFFIRRQRARGERTRSCPRVP